MRFTSATLLALPLLAAAAQQQSPIDFAKERAQYYFDKVSAWIPNPNQQVAPVEAAAAKAAGKNVNILTIDNWKSTLQSSSRSYSEGPEEWWVLITGGNKTCYGQCGKIETGFNETAAAFAVVPSAPHLAYVNCDYQPILCNSWAAGPPTMWIFEVGAPGAPVDIHIVHLNTTTTDVKTFTDLHSKKTWAKQPKYEGYFHPFGGLVAKFGIAQPLAYAIWIFSVIPSWAFMIGVSFLSRTMMSVMWKQPAPQPRRG
jgi:hypothetical protein